MGEPSNLQPSNLEQRVRALETRVEHVAEDATAARILAVAHDRDRAELPTKVEAIRVALNGLSVQTAARIREVDRGFAAMNRRFEQVDRRFDALETEMRDGFTGMRGRLDFAAAGQQQIVGLLTTLIDREDDAPEHDSPQDDSPQDGD